MEFPDTCDWQQQEHYLELYPNPNDGTMTINYSIPDGETGTFEIYDQTGRVIFNKGLQGGTNKIIISPGGMQSGLYYYRAKTPQRQLINDCVVIIK